MQLRITNPNSMVVLVVAFSFLARPGAVSPAVADEPQKSEQDSTHKVEPFKLDASLKAEDQWAAYYTAAKAHYQFTPEQVTACDQVQESCNRRAAALRGELEKARKGTNGSGDAEKSAEADLTVGLTKLTDEFIYRIDSVARYDQVLSAERGGFISPRKRVAPVKPEPGNPAPEFTLKDANDKEVSLKSLQGKVTVLSFWASWCGYCKKGMPDIQKLHEEFKDKPVVVYGINCREKDGTNQKAKEVLTQGNYTFPVLYNGDAVSTLYEVQGFPTLYVVGPDGKIIHKIRGAQANLANTLRPIIENALPQGQARNDDATRESLQSKAGH